MGVVSPCLRVTSEMKCVSTGEYSRPGGQPGSSGDGCVDGGERESRGRGLVMIWIRHIWRVHANGLLNIIHSCHVHTTTCRRRCPLRINFALPPPVALALQSMPPTDCDWPYFSSFHKKWPDG